MSGFKAPGVFVFLYCLFAFATADLFALQTYQDESQPGKQAQPFLATG